MRRGVWVLIIVMLGWSVWQSHTSAPFSWAAGGEGTTVHPFSPEQGDAYLNTARVSIAASGTQAVGTSRRGQLSADGQMVVFSSLANNLTDDPQGIAEDIFTRATTEGVVTLISGGVNGASDGANLYPHLSDNGGMVVWESAATNLVLSDTNTVNDIFLWNAATATMMRVSVNTDGEEGNDTSAAPDISWDGTMVAFESAATNLVLSDTNGVKDLFVATITLHSSPRSGAGSVVTRVSLATDGTEANGDSYGARLSSDGRFVVFTSSATNLVLSDTNGVADVFVHDRVAGVTERVSVATDGTQGNRDSGGGAISADGRYVVFDSGATTLDPQDTSQYQDVYRHDRITGITELVSISIDGGANFGALAGEISADGRYIAFMSLANSLIPEDTNGKFDIFRKDMVKGTVLRVSESSERAQANGDSKWASMSADGQTMIFESLATNLVSDDTNGVTDIFSVEVSDVPFPPPTPTATVTPTASPTPYLPPYANNLYLPLVTERMLSPLHLNLTNAGTYESTAPTVSDDGSRVAFVSLGGSFGEEHTPFAQIYLWRNREIYPLSRRVDGVWGNGDSSLPRIAGDGSLVVFTTSASNLVANDTNEVADIVGYDFTTGQFARFSVANDGTEADVGSGTPLVSRTGRYVVFSSMATNLATPVAPGINNIYWHDRVTGETRLITKTWDDHAVTGGSALPLDVSDDGNMVMFEGAMGELIENGSLNYDIYVWEREQDLISRITQSPSGESAAGYSWGLGMSGDGDWIALASLADNLTPLDTHSGEDAFLYHRSTRTWWVVPLPNGFLTNGSRRGDLSRDGRIMAFSAWRGSSYGKTYDVVTYNRGTDEVAILTAGESTVGNGGSHYAQINADGRIVVFQSDVSDVIPGEINDATNIFWWVR